MRGGGGDDLLGWIPGDGSDLADGGSGTDTLLFAGAGVAEYISLAAAFEDAQLFRDVGIIGMDLRSTERVEIRDLGGGDSIQVSDLSDSSVRRVSIDLAGGPAEADEVSFIGTGGADTLRLSTAVDGAIRGEGLGAKFRIAGMEAQRDRIIVSQGEGADIVDASGLAGARLVVAGGSGDDLALLGDEEDRFAAVGEAGFDTVDGGEGLDTFA